LSGTGEMTESENGNKGAVPAGDPLEAAAIKAQSEPLFTKDFVLTALANFANSFGMQMLIATMPVYVISLGGSQTDAGVVSGALAFTALLFRPLMGWLTDTWRRRPLILIGTSCYGLASVVYFLTHTIPLLLVGRFIHGFGLCAYTTASNAYVADIAPIRRRGEAVGFFAASQAIGLILGPAVGFMLVERIGFHRLFCFSGGVSFAAFFISIFAREKRKAVDFKRRPWSVRTGIVSLDALPMAWMALCMGMGFGAVSSFIAIFARMRGFQNPGFYFMIQAMALLISRLFAGRVTDRCGRRVVIIPGLILGATALGMLPLANGVSYFVVAAALFGCGVGAAQPATMALLIDRVRSEQRGLATSTYYTGFDTGVASGSILLGSVSEHLGFGVMWPMSSFCILLGLAGFLVKRQRDIVPD